MSKTHRRLLLTAGPAVACLLAVLVPAGADEGSGAGWVAAANSRARLTWCSGKAGLPIDPKAHELAFLELQLEPGWKTYWRMPGDAGVPPEFDWSKSSNIVNATIYYPAPHRIPDSGGDSIGYTAGVIFPIRIERASDSATTPAIVTANFGVCKNICVPVEVTLTGVCPAGDATPAFSAAVAAVPRVRGQRRDSDPQLLAITGSVAAALPRLAIDVAFGTGATNTDLFIEAPEGFYVPLPQPVTPDAGGRAHFTVDLSKVIDAKDLLGKDLRLTMVSSNGASEAIWTAK